MSINTTLAGLSTNPALNGPDGAADLPSTLDDAIRYALSFTAQLRDGLGFTAGAVVAGLGYTPVRQGTGTLQLANTIHIGWGGTSQLRLQVDNTDFGVTWPHNISGNAATATNATNAALAANSSAFQGQSDLSSFVRRSAGANFLTMRWDVPQSKIIFGVDGNEFGGVMPITVLWTNVASRPTAVSAFANDSGYQTAANLAAYAVQRTDGVTNLGNDGSAFMRSFISGFGLVGWAVSPSDERLKEDIAPSGEDSLSKISRIDFKQFRFRQDVTDTPVDDGRLHRHGVIAQQLEAIEPDWVDNGGTWKAPNQQQLLYAALHAIAQLEARVAALEGRA